MQKAIFTALAAVVLLGAVGWSHGEDPRLTGRPAMSTPASGLITHQVSGGPGGDYLVVIDPAARVMAVYRVQKERGEIALASVRKIDADLQLLSFNTERPLPEEILAGLQRQQF